MSDGTRVFIVHILLVFFRIYSAIVECPSADLLPSRFFRSDRCSTVHENKSQSYPQLIMLGLGTNSLQSGTLGTLGRSRCWLLASATVFRLESGVEEDAAREYLSP